MSPKSARFKINHMTVLFITVFQFKLLLFKWIDKFGLNTIDAMFWPDMLVHSFDCNVLVPGIQ